MRVLALADTQLGVPTVDLADQAEVLARIAELALERDVDLVIHGGDVFEGPVVTPEQLRVFLNFANALRAMELNLIVLRGNGRHDLATRPVHALDVLHEIENVEVHDRPGCTAHESVGVVTLPWVSPAHLIARWGGDVDHDQVNDYASKLLVEIAAAELEKLRSGRLAHDCAVLVAHWAISGSALPTGLAVDQMREPILSWADLDSLGFDAVIGAHIHQPQQISRDALDATLGIVVGSPQQLNFGEHGEHGVWVLDIEPGALGSAVSAEFVPIESKRFVTIDAPSPNALYSQPWGVSEGDIVRVRVRASEEEMRAWKQGTLREALMLEGASRVRIEPQIIRENRARAEAITDQLSPLDALAAYCEAEEIAEAHAELMRTKLTEWIGA